MKKKTLLSFSVGLLTATLIIALSITALAASGKLSIEVSTIDVLIDGEIFKPKDANGNDVMIFVYNGTTYAPLRALANAYGLEVGYDSTKGIATVSRPGYIAPNTSNPKLSKMSYDEFKSSLTLRIEVGNKLTSPSNETMTLNGEEIQVAAPIYHYHLTFGNDLDQSAFLAEWNEFKNGNAAEFIKRLVDEYATKAPYNNVTLHFEYNMNEIASCGTIEKIPRFN